MADLSFLEKFYSEHYKPESRYLQEVYREPEAWQAEHADSRRA
ncbi:hypothetical protein SDC9_167560 [bioreactor metagenome]|uniref:Uncharacterized protein n=1 Tax=bioreactor metagenome TaxID=1076179 RepID=A0A645G2L2_9ZZZZ